MLCVTGREQRSPNPSAKRENGGIRTPADITRISAMLCNTLPSPLLEMTFDFIMYNMDAGNYKIQQAYCNRYDLTGEPISGILHLALLSGEC